MGGWKWREIRLWEDKWVGNANLKVKFLRLFSICYEEEALLWQGEEMKEIWSGFGRLTGEGICLIVR